MMAGLEFGSRAPLHLRRERITVPASGHANWRLLYASDLHLTPRRQHIGTGLLEIAARENPDAVLLGGDLLDRPSGAPVLLETVRHLEQHARVFAVAGNHDDSSGREHAARAVRAGGGWWLHDGEKCLQQIGSRVQFHATVRERHASEGDAVRVLVGHDPRIIESAARHYDIVFAGHLHGGQCVVWHYRGRQFPGAWFSRWNGQRFTVLGATLLVSRGAADTLPVRFHCPREVLSCDLVAAPQSQDRASLEDDAASRTA